MKNLITFILFLGASCFVYGQTYRFNQYTTENGLSQDFIYSISQDKSGYLWIGTGEGLSKFDGKKFINYTSEDGLCENVITCSFVDADGTQWFGHNEGGVSKFENDEFTAFKKNGLMESKINDLQSSGEHIYGIAQNHGLFQIKNDNIVLIGNFGAEAFQSLHFINETNLLVGTAEGLLHLQLNGDSWELQKKYLEDSWIVDIAPAFEEGEFLIAQRNNGIVKTKLGKRQLLFSTWNSTFDLTDLEIQNVMQDAEQNIWLGTYGHGAIKLRPDTSDVDEVEVTRYNTSTGLVSDYIQSIYQDREGNIWIGTFGFGLATLLDDFFTFYAYEGEEYGNSVTSIWINGGEQWYGVENGLFRVSTKIDTAWAFYNGENGLANDKVTSLFCADSVLWIGTGNSGVFAFDLRTESLKPVKVGEGNLQNKVNQLCANEEYLWVGTEGGLIEYDLNKGTREVFDTENGLPHNSIKSLLYDSKGRLWIGTKSRNLIARFNNEFKTYEINTRGELEIVSICESPFGDIWLTTSENGVYLKRKNSFLHYTAANGLKSNYTYAIQSDANGNIWVGHRGGVSRIANEDHGIEVFDQKEGIVENVNPNAIYLDDKHYLWIGTKYGSIRYDPSKENETDVPPIANLIEIQINDKSYLPNEEIVLPYGKYRVQFHFNGIYFKNPEGVKYQYKLDGYDGVYSNFTKESNATYGKLTDGEYRFRILACNENELCSEEYISLQITIKKPFWKQIWFYCLVVLLIVGIVILIIRIRIARFKANKIYLEKKLEIKTREVVEKAQIISDINKDLTSSINYAQRIQSSMLPDTDIMKRHLPDSFVFFAPRDIVSGDFYFMWENDKKLIIACVDCTGHGVPGALMSMIGSTSLLNIYDRMSSGHEWLKPNEVLEILDEKVQTLLHQQLEVSAENEYFRSKDGMDMTLVEVELDTKMVHLASAKRHSILFKDGEFTLLKGDKRPIGGGEKNKDDFFLQSFEMNQHDALYLFTDGFPDQFGGADYKKLKLKGMLEMFEDLNSSQNEDYEKSIQSFFEIWKSKHEQIDDVLMIGLRF